MTTNCFTLESAYIEIARGSCSTSNQTFVINTTF